MVKRLWDGADGHKAQLVPKPDGARIAGQHKVELHRAVAQCSSSNLTIFGALRIFFVSTFFTFPPLLQ